MLSKLNINDDVEITLRDKSTIKDHVEGRDRDGTIKFRSLGYRYRSGMEFHDHLSKKDIVAITVIGGSSAEPNDPNMPELVTDDELVKECNRLTEENAELKKTIADLEFEIKALKANQSKKTTKQASKKTTKQVDATEDEGTRDENQPAEQTGNSEKIGTSAAE